MFDHNADTASKTGELLSLPARSRALQAIAALVVLALIVAAVVTAAGASVMSAVTATQVAISGQSGGSSNPSCAVPAGASAGTGVTAGSLSEEQVRLAHTFWVVSHQLGFGDQGAIILTATGYQESTLGANKATAKPNSDKDAGPLQQRTLPGWYAPGKTVEDNTRYVNDPVHAATTFLLGYKVTTADVAAAKAAGTEPAGAAGYTTPGLKQVPGWQDMAVTKAAQKVQRSAYPTLYAQHEGMARELVAKFNAEGPPPASTAGIGPPPVSTGPLCDPPGAVDATQCPETGLPAEKGLTPDALRVLRCTHQKWPDLIIGGVRADRLPDHPSGRAIDIMTGGNSCSPVGQDIADWAKTNAESLGVQYVIWCSEIWSVQRSEEGWRPNAGHTDHVHITVNGNSAGTAPLPVAGQDETAAGAVAPLDEYTLGAWFGKAGAVWSSGYHTGLDLGGSSGKPFKAVKAGTVTTREWHSAYGNLTVVDHGGGVESWYAHAASTTTKVGATVAAGQELGIVGCTGNCFGDHLHFEIRQDGKSIDPDGWLAAQGVRLSGSRV